MDTTDTQKSAYWHSPWNQQQFKTKLYDKRDNFTFPIVNFSFISSNIPASPAYGAYISQLKRYSRAFAPYSCFLDIIQLLTHKGYSNNVALRLKSSLQVFDGRHHDLVDRYEISIFQITMDL